MDNSAAAPPRSARIPNWLSPALISIISAIALILRLHMLGTRSLWVDEGVSVAIARLSWLDFFGILWRREGNMSLYYICLRGWLHFGNSEAAIRALSAITSTGAVAAVFFLGKKLFDRYTGAIAALLLAFNAFHIRYAQEARSYAALSLAVILATWCFVSAVESSSQKKWALYAVVSAAAVYLHFFAVLVVAAHLLSALLGKRPVPWRNLAVSTALFAILVLPVGAFLRANSHNHQLDWVKFPTGAELYGFLVFFTGDGGIVMLCLSSAIAGAVVTLLILESRKQNNSAKTFRLGLIALWLFLPPSITLAVSAVKPIFVGRYMAISVPALALVLARGTAMFPLRWRVFSAGLLLAFCAYGVRSYYATAVQSSEDWRSAAWLYSNRVHDGDAIIFNTGLARAVFEYYTTAASNSPLHNVVFPSHGDKMTVMDFEGVPNPILVRYKTRDIDRVWTVDWVLNSSAGLLLDKSFHQSQSQRFQNVTVSLYVRDRAEPIPGGMAPGLPASATQFR
jgi:mannosyltransferase